MKKSKKGMWIFLAVVISLILFFSLYWFGVLDNISGKPLSVSTPITPFPTKLLSSSYTCDAQHCTAQGVTDCQISGTQPKVIFRTNVLNNNWDTNSGTDGKKAWVGYDTGNGFLTSFTYINTQVLKSNNFGLTSFSLIGGSGLFFNSGSVYITKHEPVPNGLPPDNQIKNCARQFQGGGCSCGGSCMEQYVSSCPSASGGTYYQDCGYRDSMQDGEKFYKFITSTDADTTNSPKEPYHSQNCGGVIPCQEQISGSSSTFNCPNTFEIYDDNNQLVYSEPINYQGESAGIKQSQIKYDYMSPGWLAKITGTGYINIGTSEDRESCNAGNKAKCNLDKTGYYSCVNMNGTYYLDKSVLNYCALDNGEVCDDSIGNCTFPLTTTIQLVDSFGNSKEGFSPSEQIQIKSKITASASSQIKSANVNFIIYKYGDSTPFANYDKGVYSFTNPSSVYTSINNPGNAYLGQQFYLVVAITYNGKTVYLGNDNLKPYSFRIAPSLSCNAGFMSNINGQTRTTLYKGYPVDLNIYTSESGLASAVDSLNINLNLDVGTGIIPIILNNANLKSSGITSSSTYSYVYEFTPNVSGTLDPQISVQKSSVTQECSIDSARINELTVSPSFTNIAKYTYKCVQQNSPIDLTIEVKDSLGNFVDAPNLALKVVFSNTTLQQDISSILQRTEEGKYHFTYNFPQIGSTYFQISSQFFDKINTGALDVLSTCVIPDCVQNSDCESKGSDYVCRNNTCILNDGPNWLLYIGIGAGILIGVVILLTVIKVLRKPKQQVYTGMEGLGGL